MCGIYSIDGRRKMHTKFWRGNLKDGNHLEDQGVDVWIISERILGK